MIMSSSITSFVILLYCSNIYDIRYPKSICHLWSRHLILRTNILDLLCLTLRCCLMLVYSFVQNQNVMDGKQVSLIIPMTGKDRNRLGSWLIWSSVVRNNCGKWQWDIVMDLAVVATKGSRDGNWLWEATRSSMGNVFGDYQSCILSLNLMTIWIDDQHS